MEVLLLIARLILALVFVVAGIAKLADRGGSRRALVEFGVPERIAPVLGPALPMIEILVALLLIPVNTAWLGGVFALALLLVFIAGIGLNLARGQAPDCHCFGQLHSSPVSWTTFTRNLALALAAGLIVVEGRQSPGFSALVWLTRLGTAEVINLISAVFIAALVGYLIFLMNRIRGDQAKLFSRVEAIRAALEEDGELIPVERQEATSPSDGLPIGAMAPKFSLADLAGSKVSLEDLLRDGKSVLLLFAGPNCWGCKALLPAIGVWQSEYGALLNVAVVSSGTAEDNQAKMARYGIEHLLADKRSSVSDDYQARWTPAAVFIDPDGKIASQLILGDNAIRESVRNFIASAQPGSGSTSWNGPNGHVPQMSLRFSARKIGEPALSFSLPDLSGNQIRTEDLLGSRTLLLFWHPLCMFCKAMIDDLKVWESMRSADSPKLLFIACGNKAEVRAVNESFESPTLLDPMFETGLMYGTKFTPSAIIIDGEGRIASSLAIGDENVRALVGLPKAQPWAALVSQERLYAIGSE